jgi:hypothetical protein
MSSETRFTCWRSDTAAKSIAELRNRRTKAAHMRVAAIPDDRFVNPREYEKKSDYLLNDLSEIVVLFQHQA